MWITLDFKHTCPIIDDVIETINDDIISYCDSLQATVKSKIEELRTLNSDMRNQAERQLSKMQDEIDLLKADKKDLEEEIKNLKNMEGTK